MGTSPSNVSANCRFRWYLIFSSDMFIVVSMQTSDIQFHPDYEQLNIFDLCPELGTIEDYKSEPTEGELASVFARGQELEAEEELIELLERKAFDEGQDKLLGWPAEDEPE